MILVFGVFLTFSYLYIARKNSFPLDFQFITMECTKYSCITLLTSTIPPFSNFNVVCVYICMCIYRCVCVHLCLYFNLSLQRASLGLYIFLATPEVTFPSIGHFLSDSKYTFVSRLELVWRVGREFLR